MSIAIETSGSGPHLALLHGWGLNSAVWNRVVETLARDYTLHVVDLPGHGHSSHIKSTTLDAMTDVVAAALPPQTHVLGWSLGGQVALNLAYRHPAKIDRLILVATTPRFVAGDDWPHGMRAGVLSDFALRLTENYAATIKNFLTLQALHQANVRGTIVMLQQAVLARGAPNMANLIHGLEILAETDLRPTLTQIKHRTLVIQGDHDALTPEPAARWLSAAIANSEYKMIAHAAHAPFLSHCPQFVDCVKRFLMP